MADEITRLQNAFQQLRVMGFEESEIQAALENGIIPITLGKRILRTETAGFTILSWIMYQLEGKSIE